MNYSPVTISILGCGWLGFPLASAFVNAGYKVKGSTTTPAKLPVMEEQQIKPFLIDLSADTPSPELPEFLNANILILNIPPRIRADGGASYLGQIKVLLQHLQGSPIQKIIFVGSTSVIPDLNRLVTEADVPRQPEQVQANPLLWSEQMIQLGGSWQTTIVRMGGLIGGSRHPGRFLSGKVDVPNPDAPVNLIHLHDCIRILMEIVAQDRWGTDYMACADEHPSRREFYTRAALLSGLTPPVFQDGGETSFKIICNRKLKEELHYTFSYPDPYMAISAQVPTEA